MLKRKIDIFLDEWRNRKHSPLIVKGMRQCGKTTSISEFGKKYKSFVYINFASHPVYKDIFKYGYEPDSIIQELSLINSEFSFIPGDTLIFFDEIQEYMDATTSLKFFKIDGRFDVICSGSSLGVNYKNVSSVSVGYKEDYTMYSMDFEEFLWANGYKDEHIEFLYSFIKELKPLSDATMKQMGRLFRNYIFTGGMPETVNIFIIDKTFTQVFSKQEQIYRDYEDDIVKYVDGLDTARVKNMYRHITSQLAKDNHKFQYTKLSHGARAKDYNGCADWLMDAGIINVVYKLNDLSLPLAGNEDDSNFRVYYGDNGLFMAGLDEEAKTEILHNGNYEIYNGALYESIVCEALVKQGYTPYFYRSEDSTVELDFVLRVKNEIVPVEVKKKKGRTRSLNTVIESEECIKHGLKLSMNNIGFDGRIITLPYFMTFLLKRFLRESDIFGW